MADLSGDVLEARCDSMLLGRLGSELALIYHDTLHAPLPAGLQSLVDGLDAGARRAREGCEASSSGTS